MIKIGYSNVYLAVHMLPSDWNLVKKTLVNLDENMDPAQTGRAAMIGSCQAVSTFWPCLERLHRGAHRAPGEDKAYRLQDNHGKALAWLLCPMGLHSHFRYLFVSAIQEESCKRFSSFFLVQNIFSKNKKHQVKNLVKKPSSRTHRDCGLKE